MKLNWRSVVEIVAIVSVVLSLLFVVYELRISRDYAAAEGFGSSSDRNLAFSELISNNAETWEKGCLEEDLTRTERVVFMQLVRAYNNKNFTTWSRANIGLTGANPDLFSTELALTAYRFPGFYQAWEEFEAAGPTPALTQTFGPWVQAVREQLEFLERSNARKDFDVALCGR